MFPFPHLLDQNSHPVYNLPLWGSPIKQVLASSATHSSETTTHFILFPSNTITEPCLFLVLYSVWQLSSLKPQFIRYTNAGGGRIDSQCCFCECHSQLWIYPPYNHKCLWKRIRKDWYFRWICPNVRECPHLLKKCPSINNKNSPFSRRTIFASAT